jgi:hypothetical protein
MKAKIVRFQEQLQAGEAVKVKRGLGTLGVLVVEDLRTGAILELQDGFLPAQRKDIWDHWPKFSKRVVEYKNVKKKPVFVRFLDLV